MHKRRKKWIFVTTFSFFAILITSETAGDALRTEDPVPGAATDHADSRIVG